MAKNNLVVHINGDSKNLEKSLDKARESFNKVTSSTAPLNRKINDIKKSMDNLVSSGAIATEQGKAMFKELAAEAKKFKDQQDEINKAIKNGGKAFDLKGIGQEFTSKMGLGGVFDGITSAAAGPAGAIMAIGGVMVAAGKKAADFETHLDSLQALTGVTDEQMKLMSDTTLDMSKKFGISASDIVDSMGLIGSQAPELLKNTDALASVTDAAMTLAKAGSISAEEAGKAITTVMNQMKVSGSEAMNIANVLEAAEQQGAASVEYLNKAIEKSGTQAKSAGMSYVDLAAMIETVAPKFSSADVAGSQLNSTLLKLSMGADEFNPAVVGMSQALQNLSDAQLTNEQLSKMVGEANITMLKTMIDGKGTFDDFAVSLSSTNAAVDAWQMKTDNMAGMMDRLKSTWDAFLITLGQSSLIQGVADEIMMVMEALGAVIDVISDVINAFDNLGSEGDENINMLEIALDALITIIQGIGEVLQVIVRITAKAFQSITNAVKDAADWIGDRWEKLKKDLGDVAFVRFVINAFDNIMNKVGSVINKIKEWWNDLKKTLGLPVKANVEVDNGTNNDSPTESYSSNGSVMSSGSVSASRKKTTSSSIPKVEKVKIEAEEGSIKALQDKLSELNKELSETNVTDERLGIINAEKAALEDQIKILQVRNGLLKETHKETKTVDPLDEKRKKYNDSISSIDQAKSDFKIGLIDKEEARKVINDANSVLQELGLQPLELHVNDDGTITNSMEEIESYRKSLDKLGNDIGNVGNIFGTLGSSVEGTEGKVMQFASQSINAMGQMIPQIMTMIGVKQSEAMANGTASAAALPFPANIAAMASVIATVASLFASIPKFETGGIVGGTSYTGDKLLARVNSGEMILNKKQQQNLYNSMQSAEIGNAVSTLRGDVTFNISGSALKGTLKNYESKMKKIG